MKWSDSRSSSSTRRTASTACRQVALAGTAMNSLAIRPPAVSDWYWRSSLCALEREREIHGGEHVARLLLLHPAEHVGGFVRRHILDEVGDRVDRQQLHQGVDAALVDLGEHVRGEVRGQHLEHPSRIAHAQGAHDLREIARREVPGHVGQFLILVLCEQTFEGHCVLMPLPAELGRIQERIVLALLLRAKAVMDVTHAS
jgi:hypothetical protein